MPRQLLQFVPLHLTAGRVLPFALRAQQCNPPACGYVATLQLAHLILLLCSKSATV